MRWALVGLAATLGCSGAGGTDGGGGDGGPPTLSIAPASVSANASAAPIPFRAIAGQGADAVTWSLSPAVGQLSTTTGALTFYQPPATVPSPTQVTLSAALSGLSAEATISLGPGGILVVQMTTPPLISPTVTITGPGGFSRTLAGTTTLAGVAPGTYSAVALDDRVPGPIADVLYQASVGGSPASVTNGGTATIAIGYAQRPGTGQLWVPSPAAGHISGYTPIALVGDAGASIVESGATAPRALAFDADGGLWLVDSTAQAVRGYFPSNLRSAGTPDVQLGGFPSPISLAFDREGNLWVANSGDVIQKISATSLTSPNPTPAVVLKDGNGSNGPTDLAFDAAGNLWVAHGTSGQVVEFTGVAALSGNVSPAPTQVVAPLAAPRALAFDATGNLWVALGDAGAIAELPATDAGISPQARALVLGMQSDGGISFTHPAGIAFDDDGNLWLTTDDQTLLEFGQPQSLVGPSQPAPVRVVNNPEWTTGGRPAIDPPPSTLPLAP
jgi:sugar lactone lactonase YvrE